MPRQGGIIRRSAPPGPWRARHPQRPLHPGLPGGGPPWVRFPAIRPFSAWWARWRRSSEPLD
eukprot:11219797-Lingulodinium_polyedra.AAC.1